MSPFLVGAVNYTAAKTALINPSVLLVMWKIFMKKERGSISSSFSPSGCLYSPHPLLCERQMSPVAQKFYYLQVNISKPNGG